MPLRCALPLLLLFAACRSAPASDDPPPAPDVGLAHAVGLVLQHDGLLEELDVALARFDDGPDPAHVAAALSDLVVRAEPDPLRQQDLADAVVALSGADAFAALRAGLGDLDPEADPADVARRIDSILARD